MSLVNDVEFTQDGPVGIVRLIRPEKRNALSTNVLLDLEQIIVEHGNRLERLIITGVGDIFAAGANIEELGSLDPESAYEFSKFGQRVLGGVREAKCTTYAAINGHCMGGALDLALACDFRFAVPNAVFAHPGAALGIITGWGGTLYLPEVVGSKAAFEMFLTAKRVNAEDAFSIGLIDAVVSDPVREAKTHEK